MGLDEIPDVELLQILHGDGVPDIGFPVQEPPEEIPLADGAQILSAAGDDGNGGIAVVTHFFQPLPEGVVIVQIGDTVLGSRK